MASKETGLEVNADKIKYMVMSRDQNAGQSHSMKTDNRSDVWLTVHRNSVTSHI